MKYYDGLDDKGWTFMRGLVSLRFLSYIGKIYVMLESTPLKTHERERWVEGSTSAISPPPRDKRQEVLWC